LAGVDLLDKERQYKNYRKNESNQKDYKTCFKEGASWRRNKNYKAPHA
jgi:hypothetical protein